MGKYARYYEATYHHECHRCTTNYTVHIVAYSMNEAKDVFRAWHNHCYGRKPFPLGLKYRWLKDDNEKPICNNPFPENYLCEIFKVDDNHFFVVDAKRNERTITIKQ